VQALVVVEPEVGLQSFLQFRDGGVVHEIDVLVLDRAPQAFDEDVVQGTAPTVHADPDTGALQDAREFHCCELRALIGRAIQFSEILGDCGITSPGKPKMIT